MKKSDELKIEIVGAIKEYCNNQGIDFEVVYQKLLYKNENSWLSGVINKKRITFHDACEYLGEQEIYNDYQLLCSFVHGQDISSKMMPFVFYSSIYSKLFLMSHYIFKSIRMFKIDNVLEKKILKLEKELRKLGQEYCH